MSWSVPFAGLPCADGLAKRFEKVSPMGEPDE
jgi:hypothetical protein